MANTVTSLKTNNNNNPNPWNTNIQSQLSNISTIANEEGVDSQKSPILLQFDVIMDDDKNISQDNSDEPSVLSLNLFDVESVFDSDTDSDDEAYSCLPSLDLSTAGDDFYQDVDGTFIAVDYDDEETWDNDDETKQEDNDMIIMEDYQTDDKFIVTDDGNIGYGDDDDIDDFEDHNERNMVYLSNAYSMTSRNSIDFDCSGYIMDTPIGVDTPISPFSSTTNTMDNSNFNPFNIPQWHSLSISSSKKNKNNNNNLSRPEMVEMGTYTTSKKSEDTNNQNQGEMAHDNNINTNKIEKC